MTRVAGQKNRSVVTSRRHNDVNGIELAANQYSLLARHNTNRTSPATGRAGSSQHGKMIHNSVRPPRRGGFKYRVLAPDKCNVQL